MTIMFFLVYGFLCFSIGTRWGMSIIESIKNPWDRRRIIAGQKWHLPGVGKIKIVSVWPECVSYFTTKEGPSCTYIMDRKTFDEAARDEFGRDPRGNFHKSIRERILKFEIIKGEKD